MLIEEFENCVMVDQKTASAVVKTGLENFQQKTASKAVRIARAPMRVTDTMCPQRIEENSEIHQTQKPARKDELSDQKTANTGDIA